MPTITPQMLVETVAGYSKEISYEYYNELVTRKFQANKQKNPIGFDPRTGKMYYRNLSNVGKFGNYTGKWGGNRGMKVEQVPITAQFDRTWSNEVDALTEIASYIGDGESSLLAGAKQALNKNLSAEVDSVFISTVVNEALDAGVDFTTIDFTDPFEALNKINAQMINKGVGAAVRLNIIIAASEYEKLQTAVVNKYGLANESVLHAEAGTMTIRGLEIETNVVKYGRFDILVAPDDYLYSSFDMLDGVTEGQEDGGVAPSADAEKLAAVIIPDGAAANDVRYSVANYEVPGIAFDLNADLDYVQTGIKEFLDSQEVFSINNIGVNQSANAFKLDMRVVYGAYVFKNKRNTIIPVKGVEGGSGDSNGSSNGSGSNQPVGQ